MNESMGLKKIESFFGYGGDVPSPSRKRVKKKKRKDTHQFLMVVDIKK